MTDFFPFFIAFIFYYISFFIFFPWYLFQYFSFGSDCDTLWTYVGIQLTISAKSHRVVLSLISLYFALFYYNILVVSPLFQLDAWVTSHVVQLGI